MYISVQPLLEAIFQTPKPLYRKKEETHFDKSRKKKKTKTI